MNAGQHAHSKIAGCRPPWGAEHHFHAGAEICLLKSAVGDFCRLAAHRNNSANDVGEPALGSGLWLLRDRSDGRKRLEGAPLSNCGLTAILSEQPHSSLDALAHV
jgi:hypothetical protein